MVQHKIILLLIVTAIRLIGVGSAGAWMDIGIKEMPGSGYPGFALIFLVFFLELLHP